MPLPGLLGSPAGFTGRPGQLVAGAAWMHGVSPEELIRLTGLPFDPNADARTRYDQLSAINADIYRRNWNMPDQGGGLFTDALTSPALPVIAGVAGLAAFAGATAAGESAATSSSAVTIPPEAGFEADVFVGAPIAAEGGGLADLVSTLQTVGQVASTAATVQRLLAPRPQMPAAQRYQAGDTYFLAPGATAAPGAGSSDMGMPSGGMLGGTSGQVAIGLALALVLVYFAAFRRK